MDTNRYLEEDIKDFLKILIENKVFNNSKEEGIVKLVIDKGINSLSDKQKFVFEEAIRPYVYNECKRCGIDIPWSEMWAAEDNGSLCSWCQQLGRNDKD